MPLPIDPLLPEVVGALRDHPAIVLEAPPGAGKTTRVPRALLDAGFVRGEILVLQPRRLPTRLAAERVAEELGETPGGRVGYALLQGSPSLVQIAAILVGIGVGAALALAALTIGMFAEQRLTGTADRM